MKSISIRSFLLRSVIVLGTFTLATASARATTLIDTTPGTTIIGNFGEPNSATYGQTITAPAVDHVLTDFTFYMDDYLTLASPEFVNFEAYVYGWDTVNFHTTGPALFASAPLSSTNNGGLNGLEAITINTGAVSLTPGGNYVLFFTASNLFNSTAGQSFFSIRDTNPYAGGHFVFSNNGNNFGQLGSTTWDGGNFGGGIYDQAFQATFVPEPSSGVLAVVGLACLAWLKSRRRAATA